MLGGKIRFSMRNKEFLATSLGLVLSTSAPIYASSEQDNDDSYNYRVAVMTEKNIVVCYSEEGPIEVENLPPKKIQPQKIILYNADCEKFGPDGVTHEENAYVELQNPYGISEITDLKKYRKDDSTIPNVFESIPDNSIFEQSPYIEEDKEEPEDFVQLA